MSLNVIFCLPSQPTKAIYQNSQHYKETKNCPWTKWDTAMLEVQNKDVQQKVLQECSATHLLRVYSSVLCALEYLEKTRKEGLLDYDYNVLYTRLQGWRKEAGAFYIEGLHHMTLGEYGDIVGGPWLNAIATTIDPDHVNLNASTFNCVYQDSYGLDTQNLACVLMPGSVGAPLERATGYTARWCVNENASPCNSQEAFSSIVLEISSLSPEKPSGTLQSTTVVVSFISRYTPLFAGTKNLDTATIAKAASDGDKYAQKVMELYIDEDKQRPDLIACSMRTRIYELLLRPQIWAQLPHTLRAYILIEYLIKDIATYKQEAVQELASLFGVSLNEIQQETAQKQLTDIDSVFDSLARRQAPAKAPVNADLD